ncbi:ferrochelatase [Batrachochytrium salamandrivorans]|nr:ferrochelatase [Batrachochytrium salamandrivorans]
MSALCRRALSSSPPGAGKIKTGILMMNMGGPSHPQETEFFLRNLFGDSDIIDLGGGRVQNLLADVVSKRRSPRIQAQYETIGGSPIRKWTALQGQNLAVLMDKLSPSTAPHKAYTAFRYANPLTKQALEEMKLDGVERAVAFSQFPQWSCTTAGSSLNDLWKQVKDVGLEGKLKWSIIDRFPTHPIYIQAVVERIEEKMAEMSNGGEEPPILLFSAHSVPMKVVEKGDPYTGEVGATVRAVMDVLKAKRPGQLVPQHVLAWQSKVGYLPWMVPSTGKAIPALAKQGYKRVLVVPIAFTSDHIETLFEINIEYREEAEECGIERFELTEGLNGSETFVQALGDILHTHLQSKDNHSPQYKTKCLGCDKPQCRGILDAAHNVI